MIDRVKRVPSIDKVIVATTTNQTDDPIVELTETLDVAWSRGSETDVMGRVLQAARAHDVDVIVELTGDCIFMDPAVVERVIQHYLAGDADYVCNFLEMTYPSGMQAQAFATDVLADAAARTDDPDDREHVSLYIYRHQERYAVENIVAPPELTAPEIQLTLDWPEDLEFLRRVHAELSSDDPYFSVADVIGLLRRRPELLQINGAMARTVV